MPNPVECQGGHPALVEYLVGRIHDAGPLPFSEFMEAALYHPEHGYYSSGTVAIGGEGADFRTSPEVHPLFAEMLACQVAEMYEKLGRPQPFRVIELGPGTGRMAYAFLCHAATLVSEKIQHWEYHLVECSRTLIKTQQKTLQTLPGNLNAVPRWSAEESLGTYGGAGVILSNEFFDALPVSRVEVTDGRLRELRVDWSTERGFFSLACDPEDARLQNYFNEYGAELEEGQEAEACQEALLWMDRVTAFLRRGYLLTVDYGYLAEQLYSPARRAGTLLAYRAHRVVENPLRDVGRQDLTAHVNFTALIRRGEENGWNAAALRTQTEFLLALGILERMQETDTQAVGEVERWRSRQAAKELFVPGGMGETFRVLIQARDAPLEGLSGLGSPWREAAG